MKKVITAKRILLIVLSVAVIFGMVSTSYAAETDYNLWIGGEQVTAANANDVFGDGKVCFDPDTNTLTLNNYEYKGPGYAFSNHESAAVYSGLDTLYITANNSNSLCHETPDQDSYGIYTTGSLVITEESSGSLSSEGASTDARSLGIFVADKDLTINGGIVLGKGGRAGADEVSTGIWCFDGNIIVNNKGSLAGSGMSGNISRGICAFGKIIINGGTVNGSGGPGEAISHGISMGSLESDNEKNQLIGSAADAAESVGIVIWNDAAFSKGTMKGVGGPQQSQENYGILFKDNLSINGGTIIVQGANSAFNKAPTISSEFANAKIWYGDTETAADAAGEKAIGDMATSYAQKYVRVAPVDVENSGEVPTLPQTGDNSIIWLWTALVLVSAGMLLVSFLLLQIILTE